MLFNFQSLCTLVLHFLEIQFDSTHPFTVFNNEYESTDLHGPDLEE